MVGDGRRYEWGIAIRVANTIYVMTARWAHLPYELLEKVSNRIINEIGDVSRMTYDVSSKLPMRIECSFYREMYDDKQSSYSVIRILLKYIP